MHEPEPEFAEKLPIGHDVQLVDPENEYFPATQETHEPLIKYVPAEHTVHAEVPDKYDPLGQELEQLLAPAVETFPVAQAVHPVEPANEYVPAGHVAQEEEPAAAEYVPAAQIEQDVAPAAEYSPAAHNDVNADPAPDT